MDVAGIKKAIADGRDKVVGLGRKFDQAADGLGARLETTAREQGGKIRAGYSKAEAAYKAAHAASGFGAKAREYGRGLVASVTSLPRTALHGAVALGAGALSLGSRGVGLLGRGAGFVTSRAGRLLRAALAVPGRAYNGVASRFSRKATPVAEATAIEGPATVATAAPEAAAVETPAAAATEAPAVAAQARRTSPYLTYKAREVVATTSERSL